MRRGYKVPGSRAQRAVVPSPAEMSFFQMMVRREAAEDSVQSSRVLAK